MQPFPFGSVPSPILNGLIGHSNLLPVIHSPMFVFKFALVIPLGEDVKYDLIISALFSVRIIGRVWRKSQMKITIRVRSPNGFAKCNEEPHYKFDGALPTHPRLIVRPFSDGLLFPIWQVNSESQETFGGILKTVF